MKRGIDQTEFSDGEKTDESDGECGDSNMRADHSPYDNKINKNRERNREHAKRTRLRKKAKIDEMKIRLLDLQEEVGEISIMYILFLFLLLTKLLNLMIF
jgi:hypothetical protein